MLNAGFAWSQDTSDPRHFGTIRLVPKCPDNSAPVPKCLADTSALVLNCLNLQQTFFAATGRFNIARYNYYRGPLSL